MHLAGLSATCVAGGSYGNLGGQPAPLAIVPGLPGPEPFPQLRQPVTKESVYEQAPSRSRTGY